MTLVIVFIGMICNYYLGAVGAVLSALVLIASLPKSKADVIFPSLLMIGLSWGAGELLAGSPGGVTGVILATALACWLEFGGKIIALGARPPEVPSRDNAGS